MATKIKTTVGLDGEAEYNKALKQMTTQAKQLASEMKATTSAFDDNTSAQEKAKKTAEALQKQISQQKEIVETTAKKYDEAKQALSEYKDKLESVTNEFGENSDEAKQAQKEYDALAETTAQLGKNAADAQTDLNNMQHELDNIPSSCDIIGGSIKSAGESITAFGEEVTKVSAAVTAAVAAIGKAAIDAAKEVDEAYDTIATKTGATGETLEEFCDISDEIFSELPIEVEQAGEAIGEVNTRFQSTGDELKELSEEFIKFSEINDVDVTSAVDSVDKALEAYNMDASEATTVMDMLTKAGQNTGVSVSSLTDNLLTNQGTFKALGLTLEEGINLLANLDAAGVDTSSAMTGLKKAVASGAEEGMTASESFNALCESIKGAATEEEALEIASDTFGTRGAANMAAAIREGKLSIDDLIGSLGDYEGAVDSTFEATLDPWDDVTTAVNGVKVSLSELGTNLAETFGPMLVNIIEKVESLIDWFNNLSPAAQKIIGIVTGIVAIAGPLIVVIGTLISSIGNIITILPILGKAISGLCAGPAVWIAAAAVAVIALIVTHWDWISEKFGELKEWVSETWTNIKEAIVGAWETIVENVTTIVTNIFDKVSEIFNSILDFFENNWQDILLFLVNPIAGAFELLYNNCDAFKEFVDNFVANVKDFFVTGFQNIKNFVVNTFTNMWTAVSEKVASIKDTIVNGIQAAIDFIIALPAQALQWGRDLVQSFVDGITQRMQNLLASVQQMAENIRSFLHFSEPDEGPLKDFHTYAPDMVKSFAQGIRENLGVLKSAVGDMSMVVAGGLSTEGYVQTQSSGVSGEDFSLLTSLVGSIRNGLSGGGDTIIPVYIGGERIDEIVVSSINRSNYRSGGH